ncbi:Uncharacterised protein [Klebsiella pneumoniae]|nr:Uncharacterised protein [Klebsiella pneumoniae]
MKRKPESARKNYHLELMNDELNIVRHDKEKDYQPEIIREVQKTIE